MTFCTFSKQLFNSKQITNVISKKVSIKVLIRRIRNLVTRINRRIGLVTVRSLNVAFEIRSIYCREILEVTTFFINGLLMNSGNVAR